MQIGVDIGGTFTDIVALDGEGRLVLAKVPTTPKNLLEGIGAAVRRALGLVGALELLLAFGPGKAIHVVRTDSRSWTVPFCRAHAFDASLALEDASRRRDAADRIAASRAG